GPRQEIFLPGSAGPLRLRYSPGSLRKSPSRISRVGATLLCLLRTEDSGDCGSQPTPLLSFGSQLLASPLGQVVKTRSSIVAGSAPFSLDPAARFQTLQRRVERAVVHDQLITRLLLNRACDALTMLGTEQQGPQD